MWDIDKLHRWADRLQQDEGETLQSWSHKPATRGGFPPLHKVDHPTSECIFTQTYTHPAQSGAVKQPITLHLLRVKLEMCIKRQQFLNIRSLLLSSAAPPASLCWFWLFLQTPTADLCLYKCVCLQLSSSSSPFGPVISAPDTGIKLAWKDVSWWKAATDEETPCYRWQTSLMTTHTQKLLLFALRERRGEILESW